jgi:cell wall-associated NlpC family hydrolase
MTINQGNYHLCRSLVTRLTAAVMTLLFFCCASEPMSESKPHEPVPALAAQRNGKANPETTLPIEEQIRAVVGRWSGTPHKMGGNDHSGIDCSGFVQRVYLELFQLKLPRSTALQILMGITVSPKELRAGDLVFFSPPNKIRHVGIYLGNGEFAHASTTQGVSISSLNTPYWRDAYWTSKRIIPGRT